MSDHFMDPRQRVAVPIKRLMEPYLQLQAARALEGLALEAGDQAILDGYAADLSTALAGSDAVTCFKCDAALAMDDCPDQIVLVGKYIANGVGGYESANMFYPVPSRQFVLCPTCSPLLDDYLDEQLEVPY